MPEHPTPSRSWPISSILLIVFTLLSWASVPLFLRQFVEYDLDPFTANGWRYAISAFFWLPLLTFVYFRKQLPTSIFKHVWIPVAFNIAGQTAFAWGPTLLEPGFFSFVFRVQIIFVTLGAYLLFPAERAVLHLKQYWLGVALVVLGSVGLILLRDSASHTQLNSAVARSTPLWIGIAISLAAGVLFAGYGLSVRKCVSNFSPVMSFGIICQFTAIGMLALMFILGTNFGAKPLSFSTWPWIMLIASSFIGIALSHVTYYQSLKKLGVSISVGIIQLQPIITAVGSTLIFDEKLIPPQWISGCIGILGAIIMLATPKPSASPTPNINPEQAQ